MYICIQCDYFFLVLKRFDCVDTTSNETESQIYLYSEIKFSNTYDICVRRNSHTDKIVGFFCNGCYEMSHQRLSN